MGQNNGIEHRRYVRVPYNKRVKLHFIETGENAIFDTLDISIGGIGLSTDHKIDEGSNVEIEMPMYDGVTYKPTGKIIYCNKNEIDYRIGVEFKKCPDEVINQIKLMVMKQTRKGLL